MDKKYTETTEHDSFVAAEGFVSDLLDSGRSVPEISFVLACVATDLCLQNDSTAIHALTIVTKAISETLAAHAEVNDAQNPDESLSDDSDELSIINTEVFGRSIH